MEANYLTKKEKKGVMSKVGPFIARRLEQMKEKGFYYVDISRITGIQPNRLSEIINKREITESGLKGLLEGGIIKVSDIKQNVKDLSEREEAFLDGFQVHENKNEIGKLVVVCKDQGIDVVGLLAKASQLGPEAIKALDLAINQAKEDAD